MDHRSVKTFRVYMQARQAYREQDFPSAIDKLIRIPVRLQNRDVNHLLVKSLYHDHKYQLAEDFMMPTLNTYPDSWALVRLMLQVFIKNHDFIKAREAVAVFNNAPVKRKSLLLIRKAESAVQRTDLKGIQRLTDRFYHLADQSFVKQRRIWAQAMKLPLSDFVKIARRLLVDPFLRPLMRLSVLEVLRKVKISGKVEYRGLDHRRYDIKIDQLVGLTRMRSYRQVMRIVDRGYSANPVNALILKQNLRLELSYLYPFDDQKIRSPQLWVKIADLMLKGEQPLLNNARVKRIYALQLKLNRLTDQLKR